MYVCSSREKDGDDNDDDEVDDDKDDERWKKRIVCWYLDLIKY